MYPLIALGRLIASINPLDKSYDTFFFFPFYHTGGAEKVHAQITQATGSERAIIFFTRKSVDDTFYNDFVASGCDIKNISTFTGSKWLYPINIIYRGLISGYINRQQDQPLVFNGQCNFAYKLSPWLKSSIPQVELIHSFNSFSWIRLPFLPFITNTVMISQARIADHIQQYRRLQVPANFDKSIRFIVNGIPLPQKLTPKQIDGPLNVLFVGRGGPEKRVHLIAAMAERLLKQALPIRFIFVGDVQQAIPSSQVQYCSLEGSVNNPQKLSVYYQQSHVVIITSSTEGFPMVIEEGMAHGCAVLATPVGDIPYHIQPGENGFLFSSSTNEEQIVAQGVEILAAINSSRQQLLQIAANNIAYARQTFSIDDFNRQYQQLFTQLRATY